MSADRQFQNGSRVFMAKEAKIPNLDGLLPHSQRTQPDIKPTLLRVMTEMYVQKPVHSPAEEQQYIRLATTLIDKVDAESRAAALQLLWNYAAAPVPVVQRLMRDTISAIAAHEVGAIPPPSAYPEQPAKPATETQPANAATKAPAASTAAIASRQSAAAVASALGALSPQIAANLRPADELSELFFTANAEQRRLILLNLPFSSLPPARPIAPALAAEAIARLEIAALDHHAETFARLLERTLGISTGLARRLIDDQAGEPLVVVAIALGMRAAVLQRILLCLNPSIAQSVQRVHDLANLYEDVDRESAMRLVAVWQATHKSEAPSKPKHEQYLHADSGRPAVPVSRPRIPWDEHAVHKVDVA
ncbi:MAG: hypothetical protein AB1490_11155 [Pseudomonadota bacterium]